MRWLLALLLVWGCANDPMAGGSSSTGNALGVRISRPDGHFAIGDSVWLRRDGVDSVAAPRLRRVDSLGQVRFDGLDSGAWVLEVRGENGGKLVRLWLSEGHPQSLDLVTAAYGQLVGRLQLPMGVDTGRVYLVGTGHSGMVDSGGTFRFARVSPGFQRLVARSRADRSQGVAQWPEVALEPGKTLDVGVSVFRKPRDSAWKLIWSDEFNAKTLDRKHWNYDTGDGGPTLPKWGNNFEQSYRSSQVTIVDSALQLKAEWSVPKGWESGSVQTRGVDSFHYGRIEIRAWLPKQLGAWSILSLQGGDGTRWPVDGALDLVSQQGQCSETLKGLAHWNDVDGEHHAVGELVDLVAGWGGRWVVYAVEWTPDEVLWLADDQVYFRVSGPFQSPLYLSLSLAVGGDGNVPAIGKGPFELKIDYVRRYQRALP